MKLPKGWKEERLNSLIVSLDSGVSVNGEDVAASNTEQGVLKISSVSYGIFYPEENKKIVIKDIGRARLNPKKDRIIMSRANTPDLVGASAYVSKDYPNLFLPDKLWQLEPISEEHICMRWLSYILGSDKYRKTISLLASGSSGSMKNIGKSDVLNISIPLPPLPEQKAIADILSTWDSAIDTTEKLIAAKEERFRWLLDELTYRNKQKNWQEIQLGDAFHERIETNREDLPLLSISREDGIKIRDDSSRKDTSNEDKSKYLRICPGDIGYNTMRMWQGVSALSLIEGIISPAYTVCIPNTEIIDAKFFSYLFKNKNIVHQFYKYSQGLTSDTWNLKYHNFKKIKVWVPNLENQKKIAERISLQEQEIKIIKAINNYYKQQKRGLMQKLLTGEWRVKGV